MIRAVIIITNGDVKLGVHWSVTSSHFMVEKTNSAFHPLVTYTLDPTRWTYFLRNIYI
jgi:hypothetical protein